MIEAREIHVKGISIVDSSETGYHLPRFLENLCWQLPAGQRLSQIHMSIPDGTLTPDDLGQLANAAFGCFPPDTTGTYHNHQEPTTEDCLFAQEFNLRIIPRFAYLAQATDGAIEAWISPVLVTEKHPLTKGGSGSIAALFTESSRSPLLSVNKQTLRRFDELVFGRYLRLTVADQVSVLASVSRVLGKAGISIGGFMQPSPPTDSLVARLAFILKPCSGERLNRAVEKIGALGICQSLDANLPVIGPDLPDFLRQQPKHSA